MEEIYLNIDRAIMSAFPSHGLKAYGLCELIKKSDQQHPVTVDVTRKPADIHDRYDGIFYHRILNSSINEDLDMSFGVESSDITSLRTRTFLAYKIKLGEGFIIDFANQLPRRLILDGFKFIHRSSTLDLIADHEGVYNQEYGESTPYERHRTTYNIYALEYNIDLMPCSQ